jgi:hypothetical protein
VVGIEVIMCRRGSHLLPPYHVIAVDPTVDCAQLINSHILQI